MGDSILVMASLNNDDKRIPVATLRPAIEALFRALGVPQDDAAVITDVHLDAELRGEQSHGLRMIPVHIGRLQAGSVRPVPAINTLRDKGAMALLDAGHSIGQVVASRAMKMAIAKAGEFGVGIVGVRNAESFTSSKYYPLMAVDAGMIGICYANSLPMMPPHGGTTPKVGNNPMAFAAPAGEEFPFVLDFANTIAKEKIRQALAEGRAMPRDWALGRDGRPTTDPQEALLSGVLLPFGGYKAFGIGAAHEILTSVLCGGELFTGAGSGFTPADNPYRGSQFFQAIDIEWFMPLAEFRQRLDTMIRTIRDTPPAPGHDSVYVPGERGFREMPERTRRGIPVRPAVLDQLNALAAKLGVERIPAS